MGTCRPMGSRSRQGMMVVALTLFVAACGAGDDQEQQPLEVRVLYAPSGKGDRAWNDRAWRGVLEGRDLTGARIEEGMPDSDDAAVSIFHRWVYGAAPEQNELIITLSGTYTDMVREAGCPPDGRWLLHVEGDLPECDRLRSVQYSSFEPAFLAGVAAASISKTGRAATIGGLRIESVQEMVEGFRAGVDHGGGETEVEYMTFSENGFNNPELGRSKAEDLFTEAGVDVIFANAGSTSLGILEAAKAAPDRFFVGSDDDQSYLGREVIIGSVVKRVDEVVAAAIEEVHLQTFEAGPVALDVTSASVEFVLNERFRDAAGAAVDGAREAASSATRARQAEEAQ